MHHFGSSIEQQGKSSDDRMGCINRHSNSMNLNLELTFNTTKIDQITAKRVRKQPKE